MPRLTRSALTESPEPTRRSSRAATQASSTSSQATPPSRIKGKTGRGATGDGQEVEEKIVDEPEKRGRSHSRKRADAKVEVVASPVTPRGRKGKAVAESSSKKGRGRTPVGRKGKATAAKEKDEEAAEPVDEPEVDVPPEEVTEPKVEPVVKERGRSRGRAKQEESPKPAVTPSPTSRGRRGRAAKEQTPTATPSPVNASPRGRRGRKSDIVPESTSTSEEVTAVKPAVDEDTTEKTIKDETETETELQEKKPESAVPKSADLEPKEKMSPSKPTAEPLVSTPVAEPVQKVKESTPVASEIIPEPMESAPVASDVIPEPTESATVAKPIPEPMESTPVAEPVQEVKESTPVASEIIPEPMESAPVAFEPVTEPVKSDPEPKTQEPAILETKVPAIENPETTPHISDPIPASIEPAPILEPITVASESKPLICDPVIEDISPMDTEPAVSIPAVLAEPDQTPSGGTKRKSRDDDDLEPEVGESMSKRYCYSNDEQTNEAVPAHAADVVETKQEMSTKSEIEAQPSQSEPSSLLPQSTAQTSEAEAKTDVEDFEIISHGDVPSADSQEVQLSLPVHRQNEPEVSSIASPICTQSASVVTLPEVSTSEAVCNQALVAPILPVNQSSIEGAVSSQMEEAPFLRSHNPMVEDVSPVESSMDSNIGSYGDDREAVAPQASAADSNVSSQAAETHVHRSQEPVADSNVSSQAAETHVRRSQEPVADSNINEAIPHETNSYNYQPISQSPASQSEPVTSSQTSNGVSGGNIEKTVTQIKTIEPKVTANNVFVTKYSRDIFHRHFLSNPSTLSSVTNSSPSFSIVSYNILADCHMRRDDYSYTDEEFLDQNYRHKLLIRELEYLDADVVCLQEVNPSYYSSTLKSDLERLGYSGDLHKRCKEYFDEGEATFYRTTRFSLVEQKGCNLKDLAEREIVAGGLSDDVQAAVRRYLDRSDVLHVSKLKCLKTGKVITIGNIHVVWDKFESPDVQCIQVASAVKELVSNAGNDSSPFIFCGDFNSEITSPGYQLARDGYLSDSNIQKLQSLEKLATSEGSKSLVNHLWRAFQHTASNLKSAYNTVQGQEPVVTTYTCNMQTTVDYIFYNANSLHAGGCLQVVHHEAIDQTGGLPSALFPSDHTSLKAVFSLKS